MRDFRDAKAMARTLRAALAAKGFKITISQSLELIAEIFGVADWNTLAAAIRTEGPGPGNNTSPFAASDPRKRLRARARVQPSL
jgi:Glyoxalase superfamily protein